MLIQLLRISVVDDDDDDSGVGSVQQQRLH